MTLPRSPFNRSEFTVTVDPVILASISVHEDQLSYNTSTSRTQSGAFTVKQPAWGRAGYRGHTLCEHARKLHLVAGTVNAYHKCD